MKNLAAYLDDFIEEQDDKYFENCKKKIPSKKNVKKEFMSEGYKDRKNKKDKHKRDY